MSDKRWRLLLYSDPKMGKTSLAETTIGPRLILDSEGGTDWLVNPTISWNPAEPPPTGLDSNVSVIVQTHRWDTVTAVNGWLQRGGHEFNSLVIDSLTELQRRVQTEIAPSGMDLQGWGALFTMMNPVITEMRDLTKHPTTPLWQVVITALATTDQSDKVVPDIDGKMKRSLAGQIDTIAYLRRSFTEDGTAAREMVVDAQNGLYAGDRTKILRRHFNGAIPVVLDDSTDVLSWDLAGLLQYMNEQP